MCMTKCQSFTDIKPFKSSSTFYRNPSNASRSGSYRFGDGLRLPGSGLPTNIFLIRRMDERFDRSTYGSRGSNPQAFAYERPEKRFFKFRHAHGHIRRALGGGT